MRFKLFGPDTPLTETARDIVAEDLDALSARAASGWDINKKFQVCESSWELPITLALVENKLRVVDWLLECKVDLNAKGDPAFVTASKNCDAAMLARLAARGAAIDQFDNVGKSAWSAALYSDRYDLLPELLKLGLPVDIDRGVSLRQAAFNRQKDAVRFFIEHGHDPNLRVSNMVFPNNPTVVAIAAQSGDLEMVRFLVEHGADISLKDDYGDRPFSLAAKGGHLELTAYLRSLEDPRLHDIENRMLELRAHHLTPDLVEFLRRPTRRVEISGRAQRFLEFHHLLDVRELKWKRRTVIDLLANADGYWEKGFLVWSPRDRKLAHADIEHERFLVLCTWQEFAIDARKWIDSIFE